MNTRFVIACLLSLTFIMAAPMAVHADMLGTSQILTQEERNFRLEIVENYMNREDVRSQMEALGVDPEMAADRVAGLTDSQLQQVAFNIEHAPAGSSGLGVVIAVLVIILLLEVLGVTNIFRKV